MSSLTAIDSFSFSFFGDTDKPIEYYFPPSPVVPTSTASLDQPKESSTGAKSDTRKESHAVETHGCPLSFAFSASQPDSVEAVEVV
ncbi:hypothetical protein JCM8097_009057 [Rhodosporidiobolus ruineniae]